MQQIAAEMNLAETAFVMRSGEHFELRWFTPTVEVDLCGHATLASAHALWESGWLAPHVPAVFFTRSGRLEATPADGAIRLDFPALRVAACEPPEGLVSALGVQPRFIGKTPFDYLVEVATPDEVRSAQVDFAALRRFGVRGVILTAAAGNEPYDFVSRFFAPGAGIDEDPVTGSAHCALGPYWQTRLPPRPDGLSGEFRAFQASPRGGHLRVRPRGDRVELLGQAVTVFRGHFFLHQN